MKNFFLRENKFKRIPNKAYCIQISKLNPINFLYTIFDINFKILDDTNYFRFYFTLFGEFLNIDIGWSRRKDHAGFTFSFNFLWLMIEMSTYDIRHWDYDKEEYEKR